MKGRLRRAITVLLVVLLVLGAGAFGAYWYQARQSAQAIEEAQRLAELPEPEPPADQQPAEPQEEPEQEGGKNPSVPAFRDARAAALLKLDLDSLRAINEDVIGWIEIPGTPLSYPLLQGEDNAYYLNHSWNRQYNAGGSIFLEQSSRADFSDFNTIIYGHRMSDSSMFNSLRHYADETYWQEHPRVYIVTDQGVRVYEVFAAMEVTVTDPVYWLVGDGGKYRQRVLDFCLENSVVAGAAAPAETDRIITLSTCTSLNISDNRWVVVAAELGVVAAAAPHVEMLGK